MAIATPPTTLTGDERVEAWLSSHGLTATPSLLELDSINQARSLDNQARFKALDDNVVAQYASAMENGDAFPPIVVLANKTGDIVIDGNHRVAAAKKAGHTKISAYTLYGLNELQVMTMTFEANAKHGLPSSQEERIQHGVYLVSLGVSAKGAASMVNLPLPELQKAIERQRADVRLGMLGIERWQTLSPTARNRVAAIRNDNVARIAGKLAVESNAGWSATSEMATAINRLGTEAEQMEEVERWREKLSSRVSQTAGGRVKYPINLTRLDRGLSYLDSVDIAALTTARASLTSDEQRIFSRRAGATMLQLMAIKRAFETEK